jgi:hypothetical protein
LPNKLQKLNYGVFRGCSSLQNITLPQNLISIDYYALRDCTNLTRIVFSESMANWNSINKKTDWDSNTAQYSVHCLDGVIAKA